MSTPAVDQKHTIHPHIYSHDKLPPPPPRRRVSQQSRGYTPRSSPSTTTSKSSVSPVPSTASTTYKRRRSLSSEPKGVQIITRKVIRKLEELGGHSEGDMDDTESDRSDEKEERDDDEVVNELMTGSAASLNANGHVEVKKVFVSPSGAIVPPTNKDKIDWEIPRKVLHSSIGFFTIYLYISQGNPKTVVYVLWTALSIIAPADFIRLRFPRFERLYEKCLGFLMRESEKHTTNGVTWYIIGVNFALMYYPLDVATVAILILSWADTAASTIGRLWGRYTPRLPTHIPLIPFFPNSPVRLPLAPRKSLAGFLAAFTTGAAIAIGFWGWMAPMRTDKGDITWWFNGGIRGLNAADTASPLGIVSGFEGWVGLGLIGVVAGLVSAVAEALDLGSLDDNLTLPIISGGCLFGFFKLLGLVSSWLEGQ
ncbi:phosphatidate cytidylyltransferase [Moniliophthora roreri]|nr:phosphatidate cytidylyltransferase [Moniliophthora roreri]